MLKNIRDFIVFLSGLAVALSFVVLISFHTYSLYHYEEYANKSNAAQETIFIGLLTLGLMIVVLVPYLMTKEQITRNIKEEIDSHWKKDYQKGMNQFIRESERDFAHISRMIAYLLQQKKNYYWAMTWAGDSVVAYIRHLEKHPDDFKLNKEYFIFSLNIMKISFSKRGEGTFLEDNIDLESKKSLNPFAKKSNDELIKIGNKVYKGEKITSEEKDIPAVKELERVILRYIKWQCIIEIERQEHKERAYINLIDEYLDSAFKVAFKAMVKNTLASFYQDDDNIDKKRFINNVVEKVKFNKKEVREYLENMLKDN